MCNFFGKRGYPVSVVQAGHHHAQQIDLQSAPQTSQKENNDRILFTLTSHPNNRAVKPMHTHGRIFSRPTSKKHGKRYLTFSRYTLYLTELFVFW